MNTVQLAVRNVERKRARLLVTAGAMGLAGALVIFFTCLMDGFYVTMVDNVVDNECAHLQAHAPGWRADPDLYKVLPSDPRALDASGLAWAPRLEGFGLAAKGEASAGGKPAAWTWPGGPAGQADRRLDQGQWLVRRRPHVVVLGRQLADKLEAVRRRAGAAEPWRTRHAWPTSCRCGACSKASAPAPTKPAC